MPFSLTNIVTNLQAMREHIRKQEYIAALNISDAIWSQILEIQFAENLSRQAREELKLKKIQKLQALQLARNYQIFLSFWVKVEQILREILQHDPGVKDMLSNHAWQAIEIQTPIPTPKLTIIGQNVEHLQQSALEAIDQLITRLTPYVASAPANTNTFAEIQALHDPNLTANINTLMHSIFLNLKKNIFNTSLRDYEVAKTQQNGEDLLIVHKPLQRKIGSIIKPQVNAISMVFQDLDLVDPVFRSLPTNLNVFKVKCNSVEEAQKIKRDLIATFAKTNPIEIDFSANDDLEIKSLSDTIQPTTVRTSAPTPNI